MTAARLIALAALALAALAGCGGGDGPRYALDPTAECLEQGGETVERWEAGPDTPAQWTRPAAGGVLRVTREDKQTAWAAFAADADQAERTASDLEASEAAPGTFAEIMRPVVETHGNAVVYGFFPEGDELTPGFQAALDAIETCLREG